MELDTSKLRDAVGGSKYSEPDQDVIQRLRFDDSLNVPIELTDLDMWGNYMNDDLYVMDKKIREFLKKTRYARQKGNGYRTTASVVFAWIYGRKPTQHDTAVCRLINEILMYYCTSYVVNTSYMGKKVPKVYEFSKYATSNKQAYSLKLRLEELDAGKNPWRKSTVDSEKKRRHGRRKHSENGK